MTGNGVLAVVVSYNGGTKIRRSVEALLPQVSEVFIVDNGSGAESRAVLVEIAGTPGVAVELLDSNRGIGHALNLGIARAQKLGHRWLLTMDQDSVLQPGTVAAYLDAARVDPTNVCLCPVMGAESGPQQQTQLSKSYAITSGNFVKVSVFDEVGLYDEGFFIDCIDFDFSLRVRGAGHEVRRISGARMLHELGDPTPNVRFGRSVYALHSPVRRYYMYRNFGYLAERHLLRFPKFIAKLAVLQITLAMLVAFHDPHPVASYRAMLRGVRDYFARRSGPLEDSVSRA